MRCWRYAHALLGLSARFAVACVLTRSLFCVLRCVTRQSKVLQSTLSLHHSDTSSTRSEIQVLQFKLVTWSLNGTMLSIEDLGNQLQV